MEYTAHDRPTPPRTCPVHQPLARFDSYRPLFRPLIAGLVVVLLVWAFIEISGEMVEGDTGAFDTSILRGAQSLRTGRPWVAEVMRDLSGLGSTAVLTLLTLITVGYLVVVRAPATALLVAAAVIAGSAAINLLKAQFGRPRPDRTFAELLAPGMSFPSGHAAMSAIVFLTLGALLASTRGRAREQVYILAMATLMTVLVGMSRIALGVHWATDVLAGWAFGTAWALIWLLVARRLLRTGRMASQGPLQE